METELAVDASYDYVIFRVLPENRYEACISSCEKEEAMGHGPLDQLLEHLPSIKDQISEGSSDNFKLEFPNTNCYTWFTQATLTRFLHMIGSSDLKKAMAISNEMSQLDEARKFHLSLYTQAEGITSADTSKNELLRAMDSRLAALTEELTSAIDLSVGATLSIEEMIDLQNCCQHFGDMKTRNLISKLTDIIQKSQMNGSLEKSEPSIPSKSAGNPLVSNPVKSVKYNASPAKAAEMERQSSTDSDDALSFSSEDDQPPVERSRAMVRSASPRRSASPMRKVQIGRSGSRRAPPLAIKSIPYFPPRERISSYKDTENDSEVEMVEEPNKKTEVNVTRISVQDAISLFERKQKDDTVDGLKKTVNDNSVNLNKAVLRRWSSGMEGSQKSLAQSTTVNTNSENKVNSFEEGSISPVEKVSDIGRVCEYPKVENTMEDDMRPEGNVKTELNIDSHDGQGCQIDETGEKLDAVEWTRQKEAELNQMLMKFAQYNLSDQRNIESVNIENYDARLPLKGGVTGPQKEGKDEKLRRETAGKNVEKQGDLRVKKKVLEKPILEKSSAKGSNIGGKHATSKIQNVMKNTPMSPNSRKETLKPDVLKKAPTKSSTPPATRKSWPSTPTPKATVTASVKSSSGPSSGSSTARQKPQLLATRQKPQLLATRQKPLSTAPISRLIPKLEKTQFQQKDVKKLQVDTKKNLRKVDDSKTSVPSKNGKLTKTNTTLAVNVEAAVSPVKAAVQKKGTKKSSVVPLEGKTPGRRVLVSTPVSSPLKKAEILVQVDQMLNKCETHVSIPENVGTVISDILHPLEIVQESVDQNSGLESEPGVEKEKPENRIEQANSTETHVERLSDSPAELESEQETVISPAAWEESNQQCPTIPIGNGSSPTLVNDDVVASAGARVRHSLSQMLLEESSEPDIIEWGNAENPPAMIYQKDAPKGFKRLLKFTRKNKGETNGSTWASPYTSEGEGEDDGDEYRSLSKRTSENLLKVALHSKNHGEGLLSDSEPLSARSNASSISVRNSSKFQDGHASKGSRSFFSLSAFRGNKS